VAACLSVDRSIVLSQSWAVQKRLDRSRCRLGCRLCTRVGRDNRVLDGGPDPPCEVAILRGKRYLRGKWLAKLRPCVDLSRRYDVSNYQKKQI